MRRREPTGREYAYIRVSSRDQDEHGTSLDSQKDRIHATCERDGCAKPDVRVEVESGSRAKLERRVELKRLIDEVKPGDTIRVSKVDRWSRDISFGVQSVRELVARGVRWLSVDEGIDASTPQGDSTLGIMAWVADQEHKRIRERTVGRREELVEQGYWCHGARPPFGYRRGSGGEKLAHLVLEPVPGDAVIVVELYQRCVRGASVADLAAWLEDVRPDRGWSLALVKSMLVSRVYIGEIRTSDGWVRGRHTALVPLELWSRAQEAKRSRDKGGRRPSAGSRTAGWLVRPGMAVCGQCDAPMRSAYGRRKGLDYLACRDCCGLPWARVAGVDAAVDAATIGRLHELRHELARPATAPTERPQARDWGRERARLDQARERAQRLAVDGLLEPTALRREIERVQGELEAVERAQATQAREEAAASPKVRRDVLADVKRLEGAWKRATVAQRREILSLLAERVVVSAEGVEVRWKSAEMLAVERGTT